MMDDMMRKLKILADSTKYDVSCSSSGSSRKNKGMIGNAHTAGICHSWGADGRCISLLKILFTNRCIYDCEYCVNRRSRDFPRASFEPEELARLTIEFYRRNYIEGLFLSSAVEVSPDYTAERILETLRLLRKKYGFSGYIHAKIIPGVSRELLEGIGLEADRLSVNIEMPTSESLKIYASQKDPKAIFTPMRQITNTLIERNGLKGPGTMFKNQELNTVQNRISGVEPEERKNCRGLMKYSMHYGRAGNKEMFAPAGQTTQMIIGLGEESDKSILTTGENLYRTFKMKRVYYSAYVPAVRSPLLPPAWAEPPLAREHRIYQADWLLRFYGFSVSELFEGGENNLDADLDPKVMWALKNLDKFPVEVNKASLETLMRIPGVGYVSARRIARQRKVCSVKFDDLKKMGVVLKRAKYFITCAGKYYGSKRFDPEAIRSLILQMEDGVQISMFDKNWKKLSEGERMEKLSQAGKI